MTIKVNFFCTYTFFFVPLHCKQKFADIIKRRLLALVLVIRNPENFIHPKQESNKCPLVC